MDHTNEKSNECCKINLQSAIDTTKRLIQNPNIVRSEVKQKRLAICSNCEHYNIPSAQCTICGCYMTVKTGFANMKCPKDYWKEEK